MSTREKLFYMLGTLTDEQLEGLYEFISGFIKIEDVPNEETLTAMQEAEDIASGKVTAKVYFSAKEMIDDILKGEDDEE